MVADGSTGRGTGVFLCAVTLGAAVLGAAHSSPPARVQAAAAPSYAAPALLQAPVDPSPPPGARAANRPDPRSIPAPAPKPTAAPTAAPTAEPTVESTAPGLPGGSGTGRRVVYSLSAQRVWVVGQGRSVLRSYLVSGQDWQPGPGTYHVYSRSRRTVSELGGVLLRYMIRFTYGREQGLPIGFHAIPLTPDGRPEQSVDQLGQPLSAGCVRQRLSDARYLWRFAPVGTTVVVTA